MIDSLLLILILDNNIETVNTKSKTQPLPQL